MTRRSAIAELGEMAQLTFRDSSGNILIEGKSVSSSTASTDESGQPVVLLNFDAEGARLFGEATAAHVGRRHSDLYGRYAFSSPGVEEAIYGGQAMISGDFTTEEAKDLAEKINSGALPFSLATKSFSTISPSLAEDALYVMVVVGLLSLLCILCVYDSPLPYGRRCEQHCFAFCKSAQLLAVSVTQITLTLPGIAGIILSIGMGGRKYHHFGTDRRRTAPGEVTARRCKGGLCARLFTPFWTEIDDAYCRHIAHHIRIGDNALLRIYTGNRHSDEFCSGSGGNKAHAELPPAHEEAERQKECFISAKNPRRGGFLNGAGLRLFCRAALWWQA